MDLQRFFLPSGCFLVDYKLVTVMDMHVCEQSMLWQISVYITYARDLIKWRMISNSDTHCNLGTTRGMHILLCSSLQVILMT
jgi:hypothetical protein